MKRLIGVIGWLVSIIVMIIIRIVNGIEVYCKVVIFVRIVFFFWMIFIFLLKNEIDYIN